MFWWIILLIIFLLSIFIRFFLLNSFEFFEQNNMKWNIKREHVDKFEIDNYTVYNNDNKEVYKTAGKWNLDEVNWRLINDNTKIVISNNNNIYNFTYNNIENEVKYQPDDNKLGELILNNHEAELVITKIDKTLIFTSTGEDIVSKVSTDDDTNYTLIIVDGKYTKYFESFVISFIIFTHISKELNFSHDLSPSQN